METEELSADSYVCAEDEVIPGNSKGGGEMVSEGNRKRRFSDEQIKSLECTFEAQTKLEPRKKLQLARELGLQPRQVAIWFQNKRARWKSKQLEREYGALRAEYDALLSSFGSLEKEKNSLAKQLQKLAELLKKPAGASSSDGGDSDHGDTKGEDEETKPSWASVDRSDLTLMVCSAEEGVRVRTHDEKQVPDHFCGVASNDPIVDGSLGLAARQCCFDAAAAAAAAAGSFSDQSCASSSDWWEFWPLNE